jgi:hypothetical protein
VCTSPDSSKQRVVREWKETRSAYLNGEKILGVVRAEFLPQHTHSLLPESGIISRLDKNVFEFSENRAKVFFRMFFPIYRRISHALKHVFNDESAL